MYTIYIIYVYDEYHNSYLDTGRLLIVIYTYMILFEH